MALVSVEYSDRSIGRVGSILLDARIDENHNFTNEVTSMPVEDGFDITDNIKEKPFQLSMTGFVSDSPIGGSEIRLGAGDTPYSDEAYDLLLKMFEDKQLVSVQTSLVRYDNMAITSCNIPRDKDTGESITFSMNLQQVRIVENEFTTVANNAKDVNGKSKGVADRNDPKRNKGKQTTKKAKGKNASLLFKLLK